MVGLFKQKNPLLWLLLLVYAGVVKFIFFSFPQAVTPAAPGGVLFHPIWRSFTDGVHPSMGLRWLGLVFNLIHALQLNGIINRHKMMGSSNYLPALSYLTLSSALPQWNDFSPWSLVVCILLWVFHGQFALYQTPQSRGAVYNRCLVWGLIPLLEPAAYPFVGWGLIGIWVMRPFRWSEFWVMIFGLVTPYYFLAVWNYWNGLSDWYRLFPSVRFGWPGLGSYRAFFTGLGLLLVPTLAGMLQVQSNLRKMLIPVRKGWTNWTTWLVFSLPVPFLMTGTYGPGYTSLLIPVAAFQACFFYYTSWRIVPLLFFWMELIAVLWIQYGARLG